MGELAVGLDDAAARELASRFGVGMDKTAMPIIIRRPGRVAPKPPQQVQQFTEEGYTPGALERLLTKEAGDRQWQVTVRTGREASGHLPSPPEMEDRILSADSVTGAMNRLIQAREENRAPKPKPKESEDKEDHPQEKTADSATDDLTSGMAGQNRMPMGMFGPVGSTVDYVSRGLMGTGLGRTTGFLLRGRGIPEAVERRLGLAGAAGGVGLAALAHAEAAQANKRREELMQALSRFNSQRLALAQEAKSLQKMVQGGGERFSGRPTRTYEMPEQPKSEGGGMKDTTIAALVGGAGGAVGENVVSSLRSRLGRLARSGASAL